MEIPRDNRFFDKLFYLCEVSLVQYYTPEDPEEVTALTALPVLFKATRLMWTLLKSKKKLLKNKYV